MEITSYLLGKKAGGGSGSNLQIKDVAITQNGTTEITPDTGYDGMSKVNATVSGILDTSDANATTDDIPLGKSGYVNGVKVNGSVPIGSSSLATNYASNNISTYLDDLKVDTEQSIRNQFFYTGDKISVLAPLSDVAPVVGATAEKIKKDEVICGVTGTYEGGGGGTIEEKDVNFYDYDGTLLYSYTAQQFQALESMPENPNRTSEGLTAQGWNWTLSDAKSYVTNHGGCDIGQMYTPTDGKAKIYISLEEERKKPCVGLAVNGTVEVDWGDGTTQNITGTSTGTYIRTPHEYASGGDYVISLSSNNNFNIDGNGYNSNKMICAEINSTNEPNQYYYNCVKKVVLSTKSKIDKQYSCYAFTGMQNLETVVIPYGYTVNASAEDIFTYLFSSCYNLKFLVIPNTLTNLGNSSKFADNCYSLKKIVLPSTITKLAKEMLTNSYNAKSFCTPDSVRTLSQSLVSNSGIKKLYLPQNQNLLSIPNNLANSCYLLETVNMPNTITTIGTGAFQYCKLREVSLPNSLTTIEQNAFANCYSLTKMKFPSGLASIGGGAFGYMPNISYYDFSDCLQIPTIASNTFVNISSDCKIIVPDSLYETWIATSNWSNYSSYIIKKTDWDALQTA